MVRKITDPGSGAPDTNGGSEASVVIESIVPADALLGGSVIVPDTPGSAGSAMGTPVCDAGTEMVAFVTGPGTSDATGTAPERAPFPPPHDTRAARPHAMSMPNRRSRVSPFIIAPRSQTGTRRV